MPFGALRRNLAWLVLAGAGLYLAGCGGAGGGALSGGGSGAPPLPAPAPAGGGTLAVTLTIPRPGTASGNRRAQYLSSASFTLGVYVSQPGTGGFAVQSQLFDLTSTANCSGGGITPGSVPGTTCQLNIPAPAGTDDFYFVTYADSIYGQSQPALPMSAHPLDATLISLGIHAGTNTATIVLSAIADGVANADTGQTIAVADTVIGAGNAIAVATAAPLAWYPNQTTNSLDLFAAGPSGVPSPMPTAAASPWVPVVAALPTAASNNPVSNTPASPVALTLTYNDAAAQTASCGSSGSNPHVKIALKPAGSGSFGSAAQAVTMATSNDQFALSYLGGAGIGYSGTLTTPAFGNYDSGNVLDSGSFTMTVVSLGVFAPGVSPSTTNVNFTCSTQTLSMTSVNENDPVEVVAGADHTPGDFYVILGNNTNLTAGGIGSTDCASVANIALSNGGSAITPTYTLPVTNANVTTQGTALTNTNNGVPAFWVTPVTNPTIGKPCVVQIVDNAASNGPVSSYLVIKAQGINTTPPSGTITEYTIPTSSSNPTGIALGPDGALWFTEQSASKIGRISTSGAFTEYATTTANAGPTGIVAGPDGNLWFTETAANQIGKITTGGTITEYSGSISGPTCITAGSDSNLWFAESTASAIGKITTSGTITLYGAGLTAGALQCITAGPDGNLWFTEPATQSAPFFVGKATTGGTITEQGSAPSSYPWGIASGPDSNLWFTEPSGPAIGKMTTSGTLTEYTTGITAASKPYYIVAGPDGNLWFTEFTGNKIGRISTTGTVTEFTSGLSGGSAPEGITAGGDNGIWFTESATNKIGRIQP